ncbi:hypothetical protein PENSPDRAFT_100322 [Peniophora sp. CONT]|nr:hypothetical protein PENSPDRAFT_427570 [Peniophora sp. CONT]KZV66083.1 hypothetical protein PENSPDRAFT_100322 [Peniophora sp. CONT]
MMFYVPNEQRADPKTAERRVFISVEAEMPRGQHFKRKPSLSRVLLQRKPLVFDRLPYGPHF